MVGFVTDKRFLVLGLCLKKGYLVILSCVDEIEFWCIINEYLVAIYE